MSPRADDSDGVGEALECRGLGDDRAGVGRDEGNDDGVPLDEQPASTMSAATPTEAEPVQRRITTTRSPRAKDARPARRVVHCYGALWSSLALVCVDGAVANRTGC